jgi:gas vesicle protein
MGQDPNAIRDQIEQTRDRMSETVDALGYKADVPARARDSVSGRVETIKTKITGTGSDIAQATPDADDVRAGARQAVGLAQENPLGLVIGAAAAGFLAGFLLPSTKVEDERLGPIADEVKQQARETGQEALEHGRDIARETAHVAADKAQETFGQVMDQAGQAATEIKEQAQDSAQSHAEQLSGSAQESAGEVSQTARDTMSNGG